MYPSSFDLTMAGSVAEAVAALAEGGKTPASWPAVRA